MSVPIDWTDLNPEAPELIVGLGRSRFRVGDLVELADLLATMKQSRKERVTGSGVK
jgi:hypothetical protein